MANAMHSIVPWSDLLLVCEFQGDCYSHYVSAYVGSMGPPGELTMVIDNLFKPYLRQIEESKNHYLANDDECHCGPSTPFGTAERSTLKWCNIISVNRIHRIWSMIWHDVRGCVSTLHNHKVRQRPPLHNHTIYASLHPVSATVTNSHLRCIALAIFHYISQCYKYIIVHILRWIRMGLYFVWRRCVTPPHPTCVPLVFCYHSFSCIICLSSCYHRSTFFFKRLCLLGWAWLNDMLSWYPFFTVDLNTAFI